MGLLLERGRRTGDGSTTTTTSGGGGAAGVNLLQYNDGEKGLSVAYSRADPSWRFLGRARRTQEVAASADIRGSGSNDMALTIPNVISGGVHAAFIRASDGDDITVRIVHGHVGRAAVAGTAASLRLYTRADQSRGIIVSRATEDATHNGDTISVSRGSTGSGVGSNSAQGGTIGGVTIANDGTAAQLVTELEGAILGFETEYFGGEDGTTVVGALTVTQIVGSGTGTSTTVAFAGGVTPVTAIAAMPLSWAWDADNLRLTLTIPEGTTLYAADQNLLNNDITLSHTLDVGTKGNLYGTLATPLDGTISQWVFNSSVLALNQSDTFHSSYFAGEPGDFTDITFTPGQDVEPISAEVDTAAKTVQLNYAGTGSFGSSRVNDTFGEIEPVLDAVSGVSATLIGGVGVSSPTQSPIAPGSAVTYPFVPGHPFGDDAGVGANLESVTDPIAGHTLTFQGRDSSGDPVTIHLSLPTDGPTLEATLDAHFGNTNWRMQLEKTFVVGPVATAAAFATLRGTTPPHDFAVATAAFARGTAAIYLADGTQPTNVAIGDLFVYDTGNDRWERVVNLPTVSTVPAASETTAGSVRGATEAESTATSGTTILGWTVTRLRAAINAIVGAVRTKLDRYPENPALAGGAYVDEQFGFLGEYETLDYDATDYGNNNIPQGRFMIAPLSGGVRSVKIHLADIDDNTATVNAINQAAENGSMLDTQQATNSGVVPIRGTLTGGFEFRANGIWEFDVTPTRADSIANNVTVTFRFQGVIDTRLDALEGEAVVDIKTNSYQIVAADLNKTIVNTGNGQFTYTLPDIDLDGEVGIGWSVAIVNHSPSNDSLAINAGSGNTIESGKHGPAANDSITPGAAETLRVITATDWVAISDTIPDTVLDEEIGSIAFRHPPSDLTEDEQTAVKTAIDADEIFQIRELPLYEATLAAAGNVSGTVRTGDQPPTGDSIVAWVDGSGSTPGIDDYGTLSADGQTVTIVRAGHIHIVGDLTGTRATANNPQRAELYVDVRHTRGSAITTYTASDNSYLRRSTAANALTQYHQLFSLRLRVQAGDTLNIILTRAGDNNATPTLNGGRMGIAWSIGAQGPAGPALAEAVADQTGDYTITGGDRYDTVRLTGSTAATFMLPDITGDIVTGWSTWIVNDSSALLTVDGNGADTINGQATRVVLPGEAIRVQVIGATAWRVMSDTQTNPYRTISGVGGVYALQESEHTVVVEVTSSLSFNKSYIIPIPVALLGSTAKNFGVEQTGNTITQDNAQGVSASISGRNVTLSTSSWNANSGIGTVLGYRG